MFNEDKKNGCMTSPEGFMLTLLIDTAMSFQCQVTELINKYKANGVDVIPIQEIEKIQKESITKALSPEGLIAKMTKGE